MNHIARHVGGAAEIHGVLTQAVNDHARHDGAHRDKSGGKSQTAFLAGVHRESI